MPAEIMLMLHKFPKKEILLPKKIENFGKLDYTSFRKRKFIFKKNKITKKGGRLKRGQVT